MRQLKLYIATSLDGYIATADGSVEWLDAYQSDEEDYGYHRLYDSVDTLLMGGNGVPLFPPSPALSRWQLEEQRSFPSGATMLTYKLC